MFYGAVIAEEIGHRQAGLLFSLFVVIGSGIVSIGTHVDQYILPTMLFGRFIFGIGAEALNITQTGMVAKWFSDRNLSFSFEVIVFVARLGDFLGLCLSAIFAEIFDSWKSAVWIGTMTTLGSFFFVVMYFFYDYVGEKHRTTMVDVDVEPDFSLIQKFETRYWLISFICMTYYSSVLSFLIQSSFYLKSEFDYSKEMSGVFTSFIIFFPMVLSGLCSKFIDLTGKRPLWVMSGVFLLLVSHITFAFIDYDYPWTLTCLIGLSFTIVPVALWPCVPLLMSSTQVMTAFSLMTSIQNLGLVFGNVSVGWLIHNYSYHYAMVFLCIIDSVALLLSLILLWSDSKRDGKLSIIPTRFSSTC